MTILDSINIFSVKYLVPTATFMRKAQFFRTK